VHPQKKVLPEYIVARLQDAFAKDKRICELDVKVTVEGNRILLRGEVTTEELKRSIGKAAQDLASGFQIENQIRVAVLTDPAGTEEVG
jgi:osmotically-inducible protein OsmY